MGIGDLALAAVNAILDFIGTLIFDGNSPTKRQKIILWMLLFLFIIFLLWIVIPINGFL